MASLSIRVRSIFKSIVTIGLLVGPLGAAAAVGAQEQPARPAGEKLPDDTCVLHVAVPEGATVVLSGKDYGKQREFTLRPLQAGYVYRYDLKVTMPDGSQRERTLLLRGGWRVESAIEAARAVRPELMPQTGHALPIWGLAFSPDGRYVATGAVDLSAVVWDAQTGRQLRVLRGHKGMVTSVAFSPDGRTVLTGSFDGTAVLWDIQTGKRLWTCGQSGMAGAATVWSVAFSPDGKYALTDAKLWDLRTGRQVSTLSSGGPAIHSVAFSSDGGRVVCGSFGPNPTAVIWEVASGRQLRTLAGHSQPITSVAFSPDGRKVATGSEDGTAILWNAQTGAKLQTLGGHKDQVKGVAFSPDGRKLLTGALDQKAILWDAETGQPLHTYQARGLFPGQDKVWAVAFSPDGKRAAASVGHNSVVLWDNQTKEQAVRLEGATTMVGAAALGPDGRHVRMVAGFWGLDWDMQTGRPVGNGLSLDEIPTVPMTAVAFDQDARHVLMSLQDNTDHLYDVQAGRKLQVFRNHGGGLYHVACSPDGRWALTGSNTSAAYLWNVSTGQRNDLTGHAAQPFSVAMSQDGRYALTGGFDSTAILWDVATRRSRQTFRGAAGVVAVAVSPDNKQVLTGGWDNSAALWDVASGQKLRTLTGHEGWIACTAFSPDGRYLATGAWDNRVILWEAATGSPLRTFVGHGGWLTSAQLSPDNRYLLSASFDGTARLWDVATGEELAAFIGLNFAKDWLVVTPDGLFDGSRIGREMVSFRFGSGLKVVPVDRFFQDFYRPGLLNELWRGGRPKPEVQLGAIQPPAIRITAPKASGAVDSDRIAIEAEVTDQGGGVLGPWLLQNGTKVLVPGASERDGKVVRRRFEVALVEGVNRFEVCAASADGSWESEPAVAVLRYEKPLPQPLLYLVAVGVNRYADKSLGLEYARGDAEAMADLFRQRGPSLYQNVYVTSLADEQATKAAILESVRSAAQKTRPQDTLVVFLAGQGVSLGSQYYFLPSDYAQGGGSPAESVQRQGLPAADLGEAMAAAGALKRLLVFDTGQSGSRAGAARTARNPFAFRGEIERLSRAQGAFTIAASAVSEQAKEVPELKHGVLTYTLLAGLRAAGEGPLAKQWIEPASDDRVADVLEWFGFAASHAPQLSARYFGQEQDIQHASAGTSFPVLPVPAGAGAGAVASPPSVAAKPAPQPSDERPAPAALVAPKDRPTAHVVAVGVNRYAQETMNLKFAAHDAQAIAELFRRRGPALYADVQVRLVLDDKATRSGILSALKNVSQASQPNDLVVLFMAGHGTMVGQRYYFIPHEFRRRADTLQDDVRSQGLPADEMADALAEVKAMKQILILDTCASGSILELGRTLRDPMAFRTFIDRLGQRRGVFTIAAAAAGEEAQEIERLGHGVLTYALLAALRAGPPGPLQGKALQPANPQGAADVLDWFSFASGHVPRLTRRFLGKEQYVQTSGQGKSFPVLPASGE